MRQMIVSILSTVIALSTPLSAVAGSVSLTIYSSNQPGAINPDRYRPTPGNNRLYVGSNVPGYAMVRHEELFPLQNGLSKIQYDGVAALLDPTTVTFTSLTDPDNTQVISQNYLFDLVNRQALLQRFLNKEITIEQMDGESIVERKGKLLSSTGGTVVLETKDGIYTTSTITGINVGELPKGLRVKPTLVWDVYAKHADNHKSQIAYQTQGITWWADYNVTLHEGKKGADTLDISPWVSILNQTGATFENAEIKLMAGEINRQQPNRHKFRAYAMEESVGVAGADAVPKGFEEKSFFEYHLYTLGRKETVGNNTTKQIALFKPVTDVKATRSYVASSQEPNKVAVYVAFKNEKKNNMGKPLPAGRVRISKQDGTSLELIGEDTISHTPKNEEVKLRLGNAFDLVAERKQMRRREDSRRKWREQDIEVTLKNRKKEDVTITVREVAHGSNVNFTNTNYRFINKGNNKYEAEVPVKANQEVTVKFTIRTTW